MSDDAFVMNLNAFRKERVWHDSLDEDHIADDAGPGYSYPGGLYIEKITDDWGDTAKTQGEWYLILERDEWISPDLAELEARLYAYGVTYGYFDDIKFTPSTVH